MWPDLFYHDICLRLVQVLQITAQGLFVLELIKAWI